MGDWDPWEHLDQSGYKLVWARLPHVAAAYIPSHQAIVLHPGHTRIEQRSALAEELAHLDLAHEPVDDPVDTARSEQRARRWAAVRLIEFEQLIEVLEWSDEFGQVAELLEVEADLLAARLETLSESEAAKLAERLAAKQFD